MTVEAMEDALGRIPILTGEAAAAPARSREALRVQGRCISIDRWSENCSFR
jgi:hypothetical protein